MKTDGDVEMFAWKTADWEITDTSSFGALPKLDRHTTGLVAGTKVATGRGWTSIETVTPGQKVLTFDGGLQTVVAVTRHVLMADASDPSSWPLTVPAGALGNMDDLKVLPHQSVMIESDLAEEMTGDPFVLIPLTSLEGIRGIRHERPGDWVEVIQLHFERDEVVFANVGALFLCRAEVDMLSEPKPSLYEVLPLALADDLAECLAVQEDLKAARPAPAAQIHAA